MIKTNTLELLVIASFVRGMSVRDVEAALAEALGGQAAISKSTVSSICGQIKDEYEACAARCSTGPVSYRHAPQPSPGTTTRYQDHPLGAPMHTNGR